MSQQNDNRSTADWLVDLCVYAPIGFALDAHKYVPEFVDRGRNQVALARFLGKFALERIEGRLGPLGSLLRTAPPEPPVPPSAPRPAAATKPSTPESAAAVEPPAAGPAAVVQAPAPVSDGRRVDEPAPPVKAAGARRKAAAGPDPAAPAPAARPKRARAEPRAASAARSSSEAGNAATAAKAPGRPRAKARAATAAAVPAVPQERDLAIESYSSLAASQIVPRLTTLGPAELAAIGRFERANRSRRTILNRVDQLLAGR